MPANEFGPDGTQAPPPPRLFPDPLAGLVTADTWTASKWSGQWAEYTRVVAPLPPTQTEEMRQAILAQMEREQRRPRGRRQQVHHAHAPQQQHQYAPQQYLQGKQMPAGQQQQPTKQTNGVAAFIGCLVVIGFFVLVVVNILGAIFSG